MIDLEAQARELMRQGCHHTDSTANRCRVCLVVWARRLIAESRAGAFADAVTLLNYASCTCARQIADFAAEAEPRAQG